MNDNETVAAARRFDEFKAEWGQSYTMIVRTWENAWEQFTPFLAFPPEIRRVVYTTNLIESINARFRQAARRRGHVPNDQAALKVLYLVIRDRRPNRPNVTGKTVGWKKALRAFALYYGERIAGHTEKAPPISLGIEGAFRPRECLAGFSRVGTFPTR